MNARGTAFLGPRPPPAASSAAAEAHRAPRFRLVVVTAERDRADEHAILERLFARGLERLHVRKPHASRDELARWLERVAVEWRSGLVLHQHHELAGAYGVRGVHWRDDEATGVAVRPDSAAAEAADYRGAKALALFVSRSCHEFDTLRAALDAGADLRAALDVNVARSQARAYDSVFFGPVFPSISKRGYVPDPAVLADVSALLQSRPVAAPPHPAVIAIGGITPERVARAAELGFDGVAALGAIWDAADPVAAFERLLHSCRAGSPDPAVALSNQSGGIGTSMPA